MSDESEADPRVPVVCEECGTTTRVPLGDLADAVDRHNEQMHDGEAVAGVDPDVRDQVLDLVAEELGLLDEEP
jgi:hypothetical protein